MAEDWALDVKKYVPNADDGIIAGIVRYCGIALRNRDSSLVSFSDSKETDRVRENFLKKKLGLLDSDAALDKAIAAVGERMKADRTKNRVTVYYLLADNFGKLAMFAGKGGKTTAAKKPAAPAAGSVEAIEADDADSSTANFASLSAGGFAGASKSKKKAGNGKAAAKPAAVAAKPVQVAAPVPPPVAAPAAPKEVPVAAVAAGAAVAAAATGAAASAQPAASVDQQRLVRGSEVADEDEGGFGWLPWLLLALGVIALIWWLTQRGSASNEVTTTTEQVAPASPAAATGTVSAVPAGADVVTETRDGKPAVIVYFDTAKSEVAPAIVPAAEGLKTYLSANAGSTLAVSGYNDPTGNAAANAELSKNRAVAVKAALVAAGIPDASIELVKPETTTDTVVTPEQARRVEVVVR